ncbi:MAG: hypothetical protein IT440_09025 [Phycisphaeraceae bacterium]|nr:hypothetical protein [Phycisphaeraceae bacterium]
MMANRGVILLLMLLASCRTAETQPRPAAINWRDRLIHAAGADQLGDVDELTFTLHVRQDGGMLTRTWTWRPDEDQATLSRPGFGGQMQTITYDRHEVDAGNDPLTREAEGLFRRDMLWLSPALHLLWRKDAVIEDAGMAMLPISEGSARHVIVRWAGETWDWFLDENDRIAQWIDRGGKGKRDRVCVWEAQTQVGPLWIAGERHDEQRMFRWWLTDVRVKTKAGAGLRPRR